MIKSILTIFLTAITAVCMAQVNIVPVKQPAPVHAPYTMDFNKPVTVTITFTVPAGILNNYLFTEQQGGFEALASSQQLVGAQIKIYQASHQALLDTLNNHLFSRFNDYIVRDKAKFTADTTRLYQHK